VQKNTAVSVSNFSKEFCLLKHLPDPIAVHSGLKQRNTLSPSLSNDISEMPAGMLMRIWKCYN
jgi:hypothetical protein